MDESGCGLGFGANYQVDQIILAIDFRASKFDGSMLIVLLVFISDSEK